MGRFVYPEPLSFSGLSGPSTLPPIPLWFGFPGPGALTLGETLTSGPRVVAPGTCLLLDGACDCSPPPLGASDWPPPDPPVVGAGACVAVVGAGLGGAVLDGADETAEDDGEEGLSLESSPPHALIAPATARTATHAAARAALRGKAVFLWLLYDVEVV